MKRIVKMKVFILLAVLCLIVSNNEIYASECCNDETINNRVSTMALYDENDSSLEEYKEKTNTDSITLIKSTENIYVYRMVDHGEEINIEYWTDEKLVIVNGYVYNQNSFNNACKMQVEENNILPITDYLEKVECADNDFSCNETVNTNLILTSSNIWTPVSGYSSYVHAYDVFDVSFFFALTVSAIGNLASYMFSGNTTRARNCAQTVISAACSATAATVSYCNAPCYTEYYQSYQYTNTNMKYIITRKYAVDALGNAHYGDYVGPNGPYNYGRE